MDGDILFEELPAEIGHHRFGLAFRIRVARIDALLRQRQNLRRCLPGFVNDDGAVLADGEPAPFAGDAGLDEVILPPLLPDPNANARKLAATIDGVGFTRLEGLDGALRELRDSVYHRSSAPDVWRAFLQIGKHTANYWQTFRFNAEWSGVIGCRKGESNKTLLTTVYHGSGYGRR